MKYLFITTGIALGHCTRDEAIIERLLEKNNEVAIACYGISYNYFKDRYKTIKLSSIKFSANDYKFRLFKNMFINWNILFKWSYNLVKLKIFALKYKPDLIVSDWEPIGLFFKKSIFIFNYDQDKVKDLKLNSSLKFQKFMLNLQYKLAKFFKKNTIVLSLKKESVPCMPYIKYVDLIVRKEKEELDTKENLMKKLNLKREPILVMLGGSKFGLELAEKIIRVSEYFDEDFIIFGYEINKDNITGFKFKENFLEYLKISKGLITLAGFSTLSEALLYKKPCLVFPIEDHIEQLSVVEEFKHYIMHKKIDCIEEHLEYHIKNFLKNKIKLEEKIRDIKLKNSVLEVVEILNDEAEKHIGE